MKEKLLSLGFFPYGVGPEGYYYMRNCDRVNYWFSTGIGKCCSHVEINNPIFAVISSDCIKFIKNFIVIATANSDEIESVLKQIYMPISVEDSVKRYQCVGCIKGDYPNCFSKAENSFSCKNHCSGTFLQFRGKVFLGMPNAFNIVGSSNMKIDIYKTYKSYGGYDELNIPLWKYFDDGVTIVKGFSPRINEPFLHVFLENCCDSIECRFISPEESKDL